jgi:hypothetical protein
MDIASFSLIEKGNDKSPINVSTAYAVIHELHSPRNLDLLGSGAFETVFELKGWVFSLG